LNVADFFEFGGVTAAEHFGELGGEALVLHGDLPGAEFNESVSKVEADGFCFCKIRIHYISKDYLFSQLMTHNCKSAGLPVHSLLSHFEALLKGGRDFRSSEVVRPSCPKGK
jgi:hypothetical protein